MADDVRSGQDVPALPQPLEVGNSDNQEEQQHATRGPCRVQDELHEVFVLNCNILNCSIIWTLIDLHILDTCNKQ